MSCWGAPPQGKLFQCRLFRLPRHHCNKCEDPPSLAFLVFFRLPMPDSGEWRQNECSAALGTLGSERPSDKLYRALKRHPKFHRQLSGEAVWKRVSDVGRLVFGERVCAFLAIATLWTADWAFWQFELFSVAVLAFWNAVSGRIGPFTPSWPRSLPECR